MVWASTPHMSGASPVRKGTTMHDAPIPRDLALELLLIAALYAEAEALTFRHSETPPPLTPPKRRRKRGRLPRRGAAVAVCRLHPVRHLDQSGVTEHQP
jgi:hypothetical protein